MGLTGGNRIHPDEFRVFNRTSPATVAHIHRDNTRLPLRRVRHAVMDPQIVNTAIGMIVLAHVLGVVNVPKIQDDVFVSAGQRKQVVVCGVHIVHSTRQPVGIKSGRNSRVRGIRHVQNHHTVPSV